MTDIQPYQIAIVLAFLAVLFAVQVFLKYGLRPQLDKRGVSRLKLVQQMSLGPKERLLLVSVDSKEFLVSCPKHGQMAIVPVGPSRSTAEVPNV
jgi:flagellar biogenesis protein FliO